MSDADANSTNGFRIRVAEGDDWPAIWPFFRDTVEAGLTYVYPPGLSSEQGRALWMEEPPGETLVAVDDSGVLLGSAKWGPNRPGPGAHVSTASFMVSPDARGRGVGRGLGVEVVRRARAAGYRGMQFNAVVESNVAAVSLWLSLGFLVVGTVPEAFRLPDGSFTGLHVMYQGFSH